MKVNKSMKVKELIEELQGYDENLEVRFTYDYGDYCHSIIAGRINKIGTAQIKYSEYHRNDTVQSEEDEIEEDTIQVVILE